MDNLNSLNILKTIFKNWKSFLIMMFIAAVISYGASFLLKDKYKSTSVVYPVNMFQNSEESATEQLLQYFLSEDVKNKLAKDFNLYERYDIDTLKSKGGKSLFNFMYAECIKVSPTIYESIEIEVKDTDPLFAQKLNTAFVQNTNTLIRETKKNIVKQYLENAETVINGQTKEIDSLINAIYKIKSDYNILDSKNQTKYLSKLVAKGSPLNEGIQLQIKGIKEKGIVLNVLDGRIIATMNSYNQLKQKKDGYLLDISGEMDYYTFVSKPNLADKRCYPVRWVIVLTSAVSAFFLTLVFFLFKNRSKDLI